MNCPKCGSQNLEGSKFCVRCGNSLINKEVEIISNNQSDVVNINLENSSTSMNSFDNASSMQKDADVNTDTFVDNNVSDKAFNNENVVQNNNLSNNNGTDQNINIHSNIVNNNLNSNSNDNLNNNFNTINNNSIILNTNNNGSSKNNSKSKTVLIVCIVALIIVIFSIGGFVIYKNKNKVAPNDELTKYDDSNLLIPIKKDGKYGYINANGKIIVEPLYLEVVGYSDKYAVVRSSKSVTNDEKEVYQLIDFDGNVKMSGKYSNHFIYNEKYKTWVIGDAIYDKNLKKITNDNIKVSISANFEYYVWTNDSYTEGGIIRPDGKITYTYKFENKSDTAIYVEVSKLNDEKLKNTYCVVNNSNKRYAVVNCNTGKVIYDFTNKKISSFYNSIFDVYDGSLLNQVLTFYVQDDKIMYQSTDKDASISYRIGYLSIYENNSYTYFDTKNNKKLDERPDAFDNLLGISDDDEFKYFTGITEYFCDNGNVNLKKDDKELLSCDWSSFNYMDINLYKYLLSNKKNYIIALKDMKYYLVDIDKNKVVTYFDTYYFDTNTTPFVFYLENNTKKRIIYSLLSGEKLEISNDSSYERYTNYLTVKTDGKTKYYNNELKLIYTE